MTPEDLTLDEKLHLFAGEDAWHFAGVQRLGIPPIQVADCGHGVTLVAPPFGSATCFPTSVGMAATWNRELLFEVGRALGRETRAKGCGMLLGPMVNLHRIPCGGRNYETFSEDPLLTARLAAAIVKGLQSEGTAACVKSFACNNQQKDQRYTSSEVDEQTLREIYLKVYSLIFEEVMPCAVMTSYNPLNGTPPSDSYYWLQQVLRKEMGFDGVIVSDWHAVQSKDAVTSGLDIEMPGPPKFLTPENFKEAMKPDRAASANASEAQSERAASANATQPRSINLHAPDHAASANADSPGSDSPSAGISIDEINTRVARILQLHQTVQTAKEPNSPFSPPELNSPRHQNLARRVAEESVVLLKNDQDTLPLSPQSLRSIAVIGPNAANARLGGGGSASVLPPYSISVLDGIRKLAGDQIDVLYCEGCSLGNDLPVIPADALAPDTSLNFGAGLLAEYFDISSFESDGTPALSRNDPQIDFSWGWAAPAEGVPRSEYAARWSGYINPPQAGAIKISLSSRQGIARMWINEQLQIDCWSDYDPSNFEDNYTNRSKSVALETSTGEPIHIVIEFRKTGPNAGLRLGWKISDQEDAISTAARVASQADCAIVVGGLSNMFEGGNHDRQSFALPGAQVELIRAVAAANPRTIVVLYNGTPVDFSTWREKVPAILEAFYPGQEGGNAIARILFGEVNPSGKLPDTFPKSWDEVPAMQNYPGTDGKVHYTEGRMIGYRYYDFARKAPEFSFGFGLSYTKFNYSIPRISSPVLNKESGVELSIDVTNIGKVNGMETVQLYLERCDSAPGQPLRELINFSKITLQPEECKVVSFTVTVDDILTYQTVNNKWEIPYGNFRLATGPNSWDLQYVELYII